MLLVIWLVSFDKNSLPKMKTIARFEQIEFLEHF